jgi:hypothetical protein
MPFSKGNQLAKGHGRPKKESQKTIWLLQSLLENGVDLQSLLAKSILKAAHGDRQAMDLAHLLTKLLPLVANAPKADAGTVQIDTLVINRFDKAKTIPLAEGHPPIDAEFVNEPLQSEEK